jgi:hypothetical protein
MGLVSGVLVDVLAHDWRRGSARDVANLKLPSDGTLPGVADAGVARALGQSRQSLNFGITDLYVGDLEADLYTARVKQMFQSRKQPAIGAPLKRRRLRTEEVDEYCKDNGINPSSSNERTRAIRALHSQKISDWMEAEKSGSTLRPASKSTPPALKSALPISREQSKHDLVGSVRPAAPIAKQSSADFMSVLDPRLLDDADSVEVDDSELQRLQALLLDGVEELDEEQEAIGLDTLLENIESSQEADSMLTLPGRQFVEAFSKINIVRNSTLAHSLAKLDETLSAKVAIGNSRDHPTLYLHRCSKCDYKHHLKALVDRHSLTCGLKTKEPAERLFQCDRGDCGKNFASKQSLKSHIDGYHDWIPRRCATPNCSVRTFENCHAWYRHIHAKHRPMEPLTCTHGECLSRVVWKTLISYKEHLKQVHKLMSAASQKPYLPEAAKNISLWPKGSCPIGGVGALCDVTFATRENLLRHLTSKYHKLSAEEAREKAGEVEAVPFELVPRAKNDNTKYVESCVENGDEDKMSI